MLPYLVYVVKPLASSGTASLPCFIFMPNFWFYYNEHPFYTDAALKPLKDVEEAMKNPGEPMLKSYVNAMRSSELLRPKLKTLAWVVQPHCVPESNLSLIYRYGMRMDSADLEEHLGMAVDRIDSAPTKKVNVRFDANATRIEVPVDDQTFTIANMKEMGVSFWLDKEDFSINGCKYENMGIQPHN